MSKEDIHGMHETQFSFPLRNLNVIQRDLEIGGFEVVDYQSPYVVTIYFSTKDFEIPKSSYIRARNYLLNKYTAGLELEKKLLFLLEVKPKDLDDRYKTRMQISYGEMLILMANRFTENPTIDPSVLNKIKQELMFEPLVPYVATQYHRTHYIKGDNRITIDQENSAFGFFEGNLYHAERIVEEQPSGKFEIKTDSDVPIGDKAIETLINSGVLVPTPHGQSEIDIRNAYNERLREKRTNIF